MDDYKFKKSMLFLFLLFISTIFMCIGYGAINPTNLSVSGTVSAYVQNPLYVSNVISAGDGNNSESANSSLTAQNLTLTADIALSDSDTSSYVEYNVTVYNENSNTVVFNGTQTDSSFYDNSDIIYEISNISVGDEIAASGTKTFKIKFKYASSVSSITNSDLSAVLRLDFTNEYTVSYVGITGTPTKAYEGQTFTSTIGTSYYDVEVTIGGTNYTNYAFSNGVLTINGADITGDIVITPLSDTGTITATIDSSVDLSNVESKVVTLSVTSTYKQSKNFTLSIDNNNLSLVDSGGNAVTSFTIGAETTRKLPNIYKKIRSKIYNYFTNSSSYIKHK